MVDPEGEGWYMDYPVIFAARNKDINVRRMSSSGGVFHALASYVINSLGGIVYGCAFDDELRAVHIRCRSLAEVERCMGSKYSQSNMGDSIRKIQADLELGYTVLFTGTPCQVAAVRAACAECGLGCLITADIICHGVPSPPVFQEWLSMVEALRRKKIVGYEHRPKTKGWGHFERITWQDGRCEQGTSISEGWKRLFYDNRMLRPSCYRCPYTTVSKRPGNITIADFWGVENTAHARPGDMALGVSLVLVNDELGLRQFSSLDLEVEIAELSEAISRNPMLVRPSMCEGAREAVWKDLYENGMYGMARKNHFLVSPLLFLASRAKRRIKLVSRMAR